MELTSQVIEEAEFSMARRGYDPEQVDEFLEKVGGAVDKQHAELVATRERLAEAERRAIEAERRLEEQPERVVQAGPAPGPDLEAVEAEAGRAATVRAAELTASAEAELATLQRTLLLAQKTADATVKDAKEEAARMIAAAEADAREAEATTRARILAEIAALDDNRKALADDVAILDGHITTRRRQLQGTIEDLQGLLEHPDRLSAPTPPTTSGVAAQRDVPAPRATPPAIDLSAGAEVEAPEPAAAAEPSPEPRAEMPRRSGDAPKLLTREDLDSGESPDDPADDAWSAFAPDDDDVDPGPPTQPVSSLGDLSAPRGDDDAYLAELRRAMLEEPTDEEPWR
jgi:DivIVA domain-containing protein